MASSGFECLVIDMEHSPITAPEATHLVHAIGAASAGKCAALVRAPAHGVEWIKWALDSGASGVIVPMVNNKEEASQIVRRARYPPVGARSFGPSHVPFAHPDSEKTGAAYLASALQKIALLLMIESREGVENVDEILGLEGVSGGFVGPVDLRLSLGISGFDGDEPEFVNALTKIVAAGKAHNKPVGIFVGSEHAAKRAIGLGFSFLIYQCDYSMLGDTARAIFESGSKLVNAGAA